MKQTQREQQVFEHIALQRNNHSLYTYVGVGRGIPPPPLTFSMLEEKNYFGNMYLCVIVSVVAPNNNALHTPTHNMCIVYTCMCKIMETNELPQVGLKHKTPFSLDECSSCH